MKVNIKPMFNNFDNHCYEITDSQLNLCLIFKSLSIFKKI